MNKSCEFQKTLEEKYNLSTVSFFDGQQDKYDEFELYKDIQEILDVRTLEVFNLMKSHPGLPFEDIKALANGNTKAEDLKVE